MWRRTLVSITISMLSIPIDGTHSAAKLAAWQRNMQARMPEPID